MENSHFCEAQSMQSDPSTPTLLQLPFGFLDPSAKAAEITRDIQWIATHRASQCIDDLIALSTHKSMAVRRKIAQTLTLFAPQDKLSQIQQWQARESDRTTWLHLEYLLDEIQRRTDGDDLPQDKHILTVSEALSFVRTILSSKEYTIEGEIDEINIFGSGMQMYYLVLKDTTGERLNAQCTDFVIARLTFALNTGLVVRVHGVFKIQKKGGLSLNITHIELTGAGALAKNLADLQKKLELEGLFDPSRKRSIPTLPSHILLIASPQSAAISDFMTVLSHRRSGIQITLLPIKTQGVGAERALLTQLARVNAIVRERHIDLVVITRGGGAKDDLALFNAESVVRSLHAIAVPCIAAIGHERDNTLAELVADLRCSTPSQAAEKSSKSREQVHAELQVSYEAILSTLSARAVQYAHATDLLSRNIPLLIRAQISHARATTASVDTHIHTLIARAVQTTRDLYRQIVSHTGSSCRRTYADTSTLWRQSYAYILQQLHQTRLQSTVLSQQIQSYNIETVLAKGFALISSDGHDITTTTALQATTTLDIRLSTGVTTLKIQK
jgi:exodeoxyribonuclease VII large subunit